MSKAEISVTPFGEMQDMISCLAVYEGNAKQKLKSKLDYDTVIAMR